MSQPAPATFPVVSLACPACGCVGYALTAPQQWALVKDRRCIRCYAQYTPPTPVWATGVALACGLSILVAGGIPMAFVAPRALRAYSGGAAAFAWFALCVLSCLLLVAVMLLVLAVRDLRRLRRISRGRRGFEVLPPGADLQAHVPVPPTAAVSTLARPETR